MPAFVTIRLHGRVLRLATLVLVVLCLNGRGSEAHPHVWIDADVTIRVKEQKIDAMKITWVFDDFFTQSTIEDFGKHRKGRLDAGELKQVVQESSQSLHNYSYFTYLEVDGKRRRVDSVDDFTAEIKGDHLIYRFTVPVNPPVDPFRQKFGFLLYDETYYVYVAIAEGHKVGYIGDLSGTCTESRNVDKTTPLYFGFDFPTLIAITCRRLGSE